MQRELLLCCRRALLGAWLLAPALSHGQTYAPPAAGDYGGAGPFSVMVETFTNPSYPTANGATLTVSIYHPGAALDPWLPTIFFAHGYTSPVGDPANYAALLNHLASRGYNVVFSPYEGGTGLNIPRRFDQLATGFDAAVSAFNLNVSKVGFIGHSYGGGFLPALVQHEMMGLADQFRPGHTWGGTAAFMFSMAPGFAFSGGGDTGVTATRSIAVPAHLNVVEQVFADDTAISDPRMAIDIFTNLTTPADQKDFFIVQGDSHGTPAQVASHFLPNVPPGGDSASLQAWAILRRIDALADFTFTGNATARQIALGGGVAAQTDQGTWSDSVPVVALGVTDAPDPAAFSGGPYTADWDDFANPRRAFTLVPEPTATLLLMAAGGMFLGLARARRCGNF